MCLKRYESDNIMSCQLKAETRKCDKQFVKASGLFSVGKYFCAEACIDDDDDIKRFNAQEAEAAKMKAEQDAEESEEYEIDL